MKRRNILKGSKLLMNKPIAINIPILARVEGEGALDLTIQNQAIESLQLKIYEPPRLFEKLLETRSCNDVLDIVARICGICPVAYQMSATHAIENCFGIRPGAWVREMRRLFYCGEWLESHSLHIHLLAAPDFLGFATAADMAKHYPQEVRRGLRLQAYGNELVKLFGGRSVHPVGACIGGFYRAPDMDAVSKLLTQAKERVKDCEDLIVWLASIDIPDNSHDFTCVSLYHPSEYPMNEGNIVSDRGLNIAIDQFDNFFREFQVPYSNALHCLLQEKNYLVGPIARLNNCFGHLPVEIHLLLQRLNIRFPTKNMYLSMMARAVEIYYAVLESIRILENYVIPDSSTTQFHFSTGQGFGCTEAPRGMLWQHYKIDENGKITFARIVPPTSQNQARIEDDLKTSLQQFGLNKPADELRRYSEMIIRNYDPCISCSTHFLKLTVNHL